MGGLDGTADAAGEGAHSAHDAPGPEPDEGASAGGSESCVVTVELLVVLGLFTVAVRIHPEVQGRYKLLVELQ